MRLHFLFCASLLFGADCTGLLAETLSVDLTANAPTQATIDSKVDDRNYANPRAYRQHGAAERFFQRSLTLTNTGAVPLTGPLLVINDHDWSSPSALKKSLQAPDLPRQWLPELFTFWCTHVSHANSDAPGGKEPLALLNFWSYALCGDTTAAFAHLVTSQGIPARKIPLNGHVAAEYFYDGAWHIFDTDQNVVYYHLDNRTLASAADLRADPFLARRTKVFGRYAPMDAAASAFNTSLHEYVQPKDEKPATHKKPPLPIRADTLFPGEKMIVHYDQAPEKAVGKTNLSQWGSVREDTLCLVEFVIDPKARLSRNGDAATFSSGYPILSAVNHTTGEIVSAPHGQPTFDTSIKFQSPTDRISIYTQHARSFAPTIQKGQNSLRLATVDSQGKASLFIDWDPAPTDLILPGVTATLADPTPAFAVQYPDRAELTWWQIADEPTFGFVSPNLDSVGAPVASILLDPLTATFLSPGKPHFFRIKARLAGVWGEWSAPLEFHVEKPPRPTPIQSVAAGPRLHLSWPDCGEGCEYLVFGSNRLDFLPEPFARDEIVKLREQTVEETRPNKNLVTTVTQPEIDFEPTFRFYRIIARRQGTLSVPSELVHTPTALANKLPIATVLQDRWHRTPDLKHPGTETDAHFATEIVLP